jgi:hypothetical protein
MLINFSYNYKLYFGKLFTVDINLKKIKSILLLNNKQFILFIFYDFFNYFDCYFIFYFII